MDDLEDFKTIARAGARQLGLPEPLFDADGQALLPLGEDLTLILAFDEFDGDALLILPLTAGTHPIEGQEALRLLEAGYLGQGFSGAAVGLDPVTRTPVLWRRLPVAGLTAERLARAIELLERHVLID
ncbi:type III secretion system chaperone [Halochromatium roseum]|uniref:type III secretion system chaperone n=1 Tax=Halochromatium roseum TaxID=391920 RepID=UPI0019147E23|nr:type III secretion system chaperone [Halochromatium roseum]MBK5941114.1 hypothetical protein [Halochromatium roseum]